MYVEDKLRKLASKSINGNIFLICGKKGTPNAKAPKMGNDARGVHIDIAIQKAKQGYILGYFPRKLGLVLLDEDSKQGNKARLDWEPYEIYDSYSRDGGRHYIFHANEKSDSLYRNFKANDGPEEGQVIGRAKVIEYAVLPFPKLNYDPIDSLVEATESAKKHIIPLDKISKNVKTTEAGSSIDRAYSLAHLGKFEAAISMVMELLTNHPPGGRNQLLYDSSFFLGRLNSQISMKGIDQKIKEACEKNGMYEEYGEDDIDRQFTRGFSSGMSIPWISKESKPIKSSTPSVLEEAKKKQAEKDKQTREAKVQEQTTEPVKQESKAITTYLYVPDVTGKGNWYIFIPKKGWKKDEEALWFLRYRISEGAKLVTQRAIEDEKAIGKILYGMEPGKTWDADSEVLGLPNGKYIDLKTCEIDEQKADQYVVKSVLVEPNFGEDPLFFLDFLRKAVPVREMREILLDALAYSLTGYVDEEVSFWCIGDSVTGKSSFQEMFQKLMGPYSYSLPANTIVVKKVSGSRAVEREWRSDLSSGARIGVVEEVDDFSRLNASDFKMLVSGNPITEDRKYKSFKTMHSKAKIWIFGNYLPDMPIDDAIIRRILPIPFNVSFLKSKDPSVKATLKKETELAKLLGFLCKRASSKIRARYEGSRWFPLREDLPKECEEFYNSIIKCTDPVEYFVKLFTKKEKGKSLKANDLINSLRNWADENDIEILSVTSHVPASRKSLGIRIGKHLSKLGCDKERKKVGSIIQETIYHGITWK